MQVVQPDVVLVTYDALTSDISQLQPIEWEAIVVDERNRIQPSLAKAHQALRELDANFRLLLASGNPTKVCLSHVICCQTHEDVALVPAAAQKDDQKINCILVREVHLRLRNTLSYSALVTCNLLVADYIEGHLMLHKAKLCCSCLLRLLRLEALVQYASGQADRGSHLQLEADKSGPGTRTYSQLYETVSLNRHRQFILLLMLQASYETLAQSLHFVDPEAVPDQDLDSAAQQQHQDEMSKALHAHMLRRTRSEVSSFVPPRAEVVLPVMMTQRQRECYRAQLARAYEVLTDPKTPRQNSHRGGQLRALCASLKKVRISLLMIKSRSR